MKLEQVQAAATKITFPMTFTMSIRKLHLLYLTVFIENVSSLFTSPLDIYVCGCGVWSTENTKHQNHTLYLSSGLVNRLTFSRINSSWFGNNILSQGRRISG